MIKVLHIMQSLSRGGAARSLLNFIKYFAVDERFKHSILSLAEGEEIAIEMTQALNIPLLEDKEEAIKQADIIHIHMWNSPEMYQLLCSDLPVNRCIFWYHISGHTLPHIITKELLNYPDITVFTTPYSYEVTAVKELCREKEALMIYSLTDFERLGKIEKKPHDTFNVGYIGTLDHIKIHSEYIEMSAAIDIPNCRFVVVGAHYEWLAEKAAQLGVIDRFDFLGYVEDIKLVLEELDVFGYPLCPENYSTVELVLQEVMYAGIPPVLFAYGGAQKTVIHQETGLIVESIIEYQEAIKYLYENPKERLRLGENARKYAEEVFNPDLLVKQFTEVYEKLLILPKRKHQLFETNPLSGAELLVRCLGDFGTNFELSMTASDIDILLSAEAKIAASLPALCLTSGGGIPHYYLNFPTDPYLNLWLALIKQYQGENIRSIAYFNNAIKLGIKHWRIQWYIAQVAQKMGALSLFNKAIYEVEKAAPDFLKSRGIAQC